MGKVVRVKKLFGKAGELQNISREAAFLLTKSSDPQISILKGHIDEILSENASDEIESMPSIDALIVDYRKQLAEIGASK